MKVIFEGFKEKPKDNTRGQYKFDETIDDDDYWQYHQPDRGYNKYSNSTDTWEDGFNEAKASEQDYI